MGICNLSFLSVVEASKFSLNTIKIQDSLDLVQSQNELETSIWVLNYTPPRNGVPRGATTENGSRRGGQCNFSDPLVAMVFSEFEIGTGRRPQYSDEPTLESHPTFWFSVPEAKNDLEINLRVQKKEGGEVLYEKDLEFLKKQTGSIVGFQLPGSLKGFDTGETYRWILQIDCDENTPPVRVSAVMEHVDIELNSLEEETNTANSRERIEQLASYGLLHDTLSKLVPLYMQSPQEYQATLDHLLEFANMNALVPVKVEDFLLLSEVY